MCGGGVALHRIGRLPSVVGITPVMMALREGAQTGAAEKAASYRSPAAASPSSRGVWAAPP
jgi:hypothetical protein